MAGVTAADFMARSEMTLSLELAIYKTLRQLLKRKLAGVPVVPDRSANRHADR